MGLPILGVLDEDDKESSGEDKDDEEKGKKGQGTEFCKCICCEDPEALSLELSTKTKGFGNLMHGGSTTGDQQYVAVFSPAFELQVPRRR
eukprot:8931043-Ditylum_brightwellii.AAC.1